MLTGKPWRLGTRAKLLLRGFRYARLLPYASVDGWLSVDEAIALYELARGLPAEGARAVEIGCWQGKSTICIAAGLRGKANARLTCIDPFDASGDGASAGTYWARAEALGSPLRQAFEANLHRAGALDLIDIRQGLSHEQVARYQEPLDLLFIDGDHEHRAVQRDVREWTPKLRPGGVLAMHDVAHPVHDGPRRVVEEHILPDAAWIDCHYVDSMFVARRATA